MANRFRVVVSPQAESMASGIYNIGACGISHEDFHGGNMLVREDLLLPVCFVEFSTAEALEKELDPIYMLVYVCLSLPIFQATRGTHTRG